MVPVEGHLLGEEDGLQLAALEVLHKLHNRVGRHLLGLGHVLDLDLIFGHEAQAWRLHARHVEELELGARRLDVDVEEQGTAAVAARRVLELVEHRLEAYSQLAHEQEHVQRHLVHVVSFVHLKYDNKNHVVFFMMRITFCEVTS